MIVRLVRRLAAGLAAAAAFSISADAAARPLVVILAEPEGTVATDLLAPYAVLAESGPSTSGSSHRPRRRSG